MSNESTKVNSYPSLAPSLDYEARLPAGTVGILAGLGPLAGAHFYRRLIERTPSHKDSDHLSVVLMSDPTIPSRVDNLFGNGPTPVPALIRLARLLEQLGASVIAMPSSTTHAYYNDLQDAVDIRIINLLAEVALQVRERGYSRPAILATTPTVDLNLYQPYLAGLADPIYPDPITQSKVHDLVFSLKGGKDVNHLSELLVEMINGNWSREADSIVLACTELCLADIDQLENSGLGVPIISSADVLADSVIEFIHTTK